MFANDNPAPSTRHNKPLLAAGARCCRYIVSEGTRDAIVCGATTTSDLSSWCPAHSRIVYEPRMTAAERLQRKAA